MSTLPESQITFKQVFQSVHKYLEDTLEELFTINEEDNILHILGAIRQASLSIGGKILEQWIAKKLGKGYCGSTITRDGHTFRFKEYRERTYTSGVGTIRIKRAYYYCSALQKGFIPLEEKYPWLQKHFLPDSQEIAVMAASVDPFGQAEKLIRTLAGISISASAIESIVQEVGESVEEATDTEQTPPDTTPIPQLLVVSADGAMIRVENQWREVKTGAVYEIGKKKDGTQTAFNKSYVSRVEDHESFGKRLFLEAQRRGVESAQEKVVIGDGARWIWEMASDYYPGACEIIDWYHAVEHLWSFVELLLGHRDTDLAKGMVNEWQNLLWDGRVETLIQRMSIHLKGKDDDQRKPLETAIEYFRKNKKRMLYDRFRAAGYPIGSGVIEGACKNLVQQRMKRAGMNWSLAGAHVVLTLRCMLLSNRWSVVQQQLARAG